MSKEVRTKVQNDRSKAIMANLEREWKEREKDNPKQRLTNKEKRESDQTRGDNSVTHLKSIQDDTERLNLAANTGCKLFVRLSIKLAHLYLTQSETAVQRHRSPSSVDIIHTKQTYLPQMHCVSSGISSPALLGYIVAYASPVSCSLKQFPSPL